MSDAFRGLFDTRVGFTHVASIASHSRSLGAITMIAVLLAGATPVLARQTQPVAVEGSDGKATRLEVGKPVAREIGGGQTHRYLIGLEAGQLLDATVEQKSVDVAVVLLGPGGETVFEIDSPNGANGPEPVLVVAERAGDYTIEVKTLDPSDRGGRYEARVGEIRTATEKDRQLVEATRLFGQSGLLASDGKRREALELAERAVPLYEKALGQEHPSTATSLNNLAQLYVETGAYAKAEPLFVRALAIREKALGQEHPDTAQSLNNLAELYFRQGQYAKAEPLFVRALAIYEKALGPEHPLTANSLNNLAFLYFSQGQYAKAEPLFVRALAIYEKALGPEHPETATSLNNLALLYKSQGQYAKAEPLSVRALAIKEKALGPEHPATATSLNNLALLYYSQRQYAKVEPLYVRALAIYEKALGPEHPLTATALNNLASLYERQGQNAKAEPLSVRALAIREKALGPEHPDTAQALNNLAGLYCSQGQYAKAEPLYVRVLAIYEKALGPEHPDTAQALNNLALLYTAQEDYPRAISIQARANETRERDLLRNLASGSEREKLLYLQLSSGELDRTLSLHAQRAPSDPTAERIALEIILRRKGRALDAMTDAIEALRRRASPEDAALLDELTQARSDLSRRTLAGPGRAGIDAHRADLARLEKRVEDLEGDVASRSAEFRAVSPSVTLAAVQRQIPAGALLVEFASYFPFDAKTRKSSERRYAVYTLGPKGEPAWADLGEAKPIDAAVTSLRLLLRTSTSPVAEVRRQARALDELVMRPVRRLAGSTRNLLLVPDGALNLVPFAALVDEQGHFLVERYTLSYLTSGRDLLRLAVKPAGATAPMILADPDFDASLGPPSTPDAGPREPVSGMLADMRFAALPGTAQEASALARLLRGVKVLTAAGASESALKAASHPKLLHIATHGFFVNQEISAPEAESRGFQALTASTASDSGMPALAVSNPLLRSGLALAGFNRHAGGDDDGVLTALEVAGLDLWGTEIVVLSACDTGVGEVRSGDGVYGLRRALVLAGARTQMMSLWPVSDDGTRDLMIAYYTRLLTGDGRSEGLRRVQLALLATPTRSHPYFWASFIQSGAWGPLSKTN